MSSTLQAELLAFRKRHALSQGACAKLIETSVRTLQGWEQGERAPPSMLRPLLERLDEHLKNLADQAARMERAAAHARAWKAAKDSHPELDEIDWSEQEAEKQREEIDDIIRRANISANKFRNTFERTRIELEQLRNSSGHYTKPDIKLSIRDWSLGDKIVAHGRGTTIPECLVSWQKIEEMAARLKINPFHLLQVIDAGKHAALKDADDTSSPVERP